MKYLFLIACFFAPLCSHEIAVRGPTGKVHIFDVNPEESLCSVISHINSRIAEAEGRQCSQNDFWIDYSLSNQPVFKKVKNSKVVRNYTKGYSNEDKRQIAYIVNTLAWGSIPEVISKKHSLEKAGDKVAHVHPLHFTAVIFTDEELKAGIHAIRGRISLIWNGFMDGLSKSLKEETAANNLTPEQILDFSNKVGVPYDLVAVPLSQHRWEDFVDVLIQNLPRTGNRGRYGI